MRRIVVIVTALLLFAADAYAECTMTTIYGSDRVIICTTCCTGGVCTTTCS